MAVTQVHWVCLRYLKSDRFYAKSNPSPTHSFCPPRAFRIFLPDPQTEGFEAGAHRERGQGREVVRAGKHVDTTKGQAWHGVKGEGKRKGVRGEEAGLE